ncbi:MAG: tetratricopeptide repeat protein [Betaproteobacteria bacterium]|nr:MAG: tetratricopeptide repeat protein [Betaproteobacteria bacterium]
MLVRSQPGAPAQPWPAPFEATPCVACRSAPVHKDDSVNRFARGIACCILGALGLLTACEGDRPESLITSAKGYIAKRDYKAAAIQLKTALQKEPNSSEARFLLGSVLLDAGDATSAIVELRKAIALNHPRAQVIPVLARAMLLKGQLQPLATEFAATDLGDGAATADLKTSLALAYARQGKGKEAQAALESALRSSPTSARARSLQARFKAEAGDFDGALALLNEILAKAPDNVDAWQLKGDLLYVVKKDVAGALDAHRNALKARPDLVASHASILSILVTQKDLAGAKRQLDDLKKVAPNHLETKYFEAELALLNNDFKTAKEISQQLLKVAPENVKILQLAGAVEYQSGSILQAKHLLGRALQIAPNMAATRRLLARAY